MVGDVWVEAGGVLTFGGCVGVLCFVMLGEHGEEFEHGGLGMGAGDVCLTGWTEKVTLVGEVVLEGSA